MLRRTALLSLVAALAACDKSPAAITARSAAAPASAPSSPAPSASTSSPRATAITRDDFNRVAVELDLPVYWTSDKNKNGAIDPDEVASLLFYPETATWVQDGKLTPAFEAALARITAAKASTGDPRTDLVVRDLDQGVPTLVYNDLRAFTAPEKAFVRHVLAAAKKVDEIYAAQRGLPALASKIPAGDVASRSLFRRNWGPKCVAPKTEHDPQCSAIAGAPKPVVDPYPAEMQSDAKFCEAIEKHADEKKLLGPFTVIRSKAGKLEAVSYAEAYKEPMAAVAAELRAAAASLTTPDEGPMRAYLAAAAQSFLDNDWAPSDEAWSKMNAQNSKFYLRIGPDETYWEPCSHKAGFHTTFARINGDSIAWQKKLSPVQQEMEKTLAALIGEPYKARAVTFHLPDFIDILVNGGDDRTPLGATIGQSLPNFGAVAKEGRGRTVAMSNLYTDADSIQRRHGQAASLLTKESLAAYSERPEPGLLSTILHEATHNLGPAQEYTYRGKSAEQAFGGGLASTMEELKAQSGALYFVDFLKRKGIIDAELARQTYVDSIVWTFGHVSEGMWIDGSKRRPYSQLSAIQLGFLIDEGALTFDANAMAANGTDKGALSIHFEKLPAAIEKLMKKVASAKASNDKDAAEAWSKRYVDGDVVPQKVITERYLRAPRASFVYALSID